METSTGPDIALPKEWLLGLSLDERLTTRYPIVSRAFPENQAGREHLAHWLNARVYKNSLERLQYRLTPVGLDEYGLVDLLSESPSDLARRQPKVPSSLNKPAMIIESSAMADAPIPSWASACNFERFPAACLKLARPFLVQPLAELERALAELLVDHPEFPCPIGDLCSLTFQWLAKRIYQPFLRTLALEVNIARLVGELDAPTREERFDQFIDGLCRPDELRQFYREYPVLARQTSQTIDYWLNEAVEFSSRLARDWKDILGSGFVDQDCGKLIALEAGEGDGHRQGRSVIKLTFESGSQLIYKPRPLSLDQHFVELIDWVNLKMGSVFPDFPKLKAAEVIDHGSYGWCKFINSENCSDVDEITRFYIRQGGFLALLYLLDATDFHSENVIAEGEHPVLIDLEALFQPRAGGAETTGDPAERAWLDSVMRVGYLPQRTNGHDGDPGYDISGLGHRPGQKLAKPEAVMLALATDEMRVSEELDEIGLDPNAPSLAGERVDLMPFLDRVCEGFEKVIRMIMTNRQGFITGPLEAFRHDEVRAILWPTQAYDLLLRRSFHPDYLRDGLHREYIFNHLSRDGFGNCWDAVIQSERQDLLDRDIPVFYAIASEPWIRDSRGAQVLVVNGETGFQRAVNRVREFNEEQIERQLWFIKAAYSTIPIDDGNMDWVSSDLNASASPVEPNEALEQAMRIGDRIGELAIPDGNQAGWLGIGMVSDRHWALTPASVDLYDGSAGISLFLAYLAVVSGQSRYRHLARQGIESVNEKAAKLCKIDTIQNPGAFGNIGGTIYALTHVGMLWNDNSLIDQATLTALDARRHVEAATNIELLGGISGFATVLTGLLSVAPNNELFDLAKFCADKIVDSLALDVFPSLSWPSSIPSHAPLTGLSHGAAGIALSLSRLAKYLNDPRYMVASQRLVDYEQSVFSERYGNWPDFRCFAPTCVPLQVDQLKTWNSFYTTWCHGAPGIGLSRLSMVADGHGTVGIEADINAAIAQTIAHGFGLNHSLCHGDLGNLELLIMAGDRVPKAQYTKWLSMIVASIRDQGWLTGVPLGTETPGLMTGISGIGYGLLRQIAPATVPSVLTLEPPFSTDRRPQSHGYQH